MIGTLNEGALHAGLKEWYRRPRDRPEEKVDGYVVDLVRGRLLIEIQTGNFTPLRRKLDALLPSHRVRLVAPVALSRRIEKHWRLVGKQRPPSFLSCRDRALTLSFSGSQGGEVYSAGPY